jgi:hypothetical protein
MGHRRNHEYEYVSYDWRKNGFVTANERVTDRHNRGFRVLPVSLSRLIEQMTYKYVP